MFLKKIKSLDRSKIFQNGDVSSKIIKENADFFTDYFHSALNEASESGNFPSCLIFKKGLRSQVDSSRPVRILLNASKLFERPLFEQMYYFLTKYLQRISAVLKKV